jgi:hypothetical protein
MLLLVGMFCKRDRLVSIWMEWLRFLSGVPDVGELLEMIVDDGFAVFPNFLVVLQLIWRSYETYVKVYVWQGNVV